jgi:hypothetical protein
VDIELKAPALYYVESNSREVRMQERALHCLANKTSRVLRFACRQSGLLQD